MRGKAPRLVFSQGVCFPFVLRATSANHNCQRYRKSRSGIFLALSVAVVKRVKNFHAREKGSGL